MRMPIRLSEAYFRNKTERGRSVRAFRYGICICMILMFFFFCVRVGNYVCANYQIWIQEKLLQAAVGTYTPAIAYSSAEQNSLVARKALTWTIKMNPLLDRMEKSARGSVYREDQQTVAMILKMQAEDENAVDEDGQLIGTEVPEEAVSTAQPEVTEDFSPEKLQDFDYLLSRFYLVDSTTSIDASQLNYNDLMSRSMEINTQTEGPKVLVYHTHSQEEFADSIPGDPGTSIVGIGAYLTELLNQKGIQTIHDDRVYDMIDGQLDRSMAYDYSKEGALEILSQNPSIEVVIDLHRDGVGEDTHLVTDINGKPTARIMFFNGLSRSNLTGDIEYLYNPYIQDNLSFSFQMMLECEKSYPGWARRIYLRAYRYNLELMPKDLLIEAGAQTNTVEEMRNAMEILSDALYRVLTGQQH